MRHHASPRQAPASRKENAKKSQERHCARNYTTRAQSPPSPAFRRDDRQFCPRKAQRLASQVVDALSEMPVARDCPFEIVQRHVGAEVGRLTRHLEMHVVRCARGRESNEAG